MENQAALIQQYWALRFKKNARQKKMLLEANSNGQLRSELNVTPLVDVVLVLLIIFMVITPVVVESMGLKLPQTLFHEQKNSEKGFEISVACVDANDEKKQCEKGVLYYQNRKIELNEVAVLLEAEGIGKASVEVQIRADKRLVWEAIKPLLDEIARNKKLGVVFYSEQKK